LLAKGADANAKDLPPDTRRVWQRVWDSIRGKKLPIQPAQSALLLAVQGPPEGDAARENLPIVKALLDKGADVNAKDKQGMTVLMSAVVYQHLATVQILLDRGANVNLKDSNWDVVIYDRGMKGIWHHWGQTALQYAECGNIQAMQLLLNHGANADARYPSGQTPLMYAAACGMMGKVRVLFAARADVNARDNNGETALMYCTEGPEDNPKTLQLLLSLGADANVKSKAGTTALSIAQKENYTESIRLLKKASASQ
jgi:uncharacterized protein